jgi:hypothetical protein
MYTNVDPFWAVIVIVTTFNPIFKLITGEVEPELTIFPFIFIDALVSRATGVSVIEDTEFITEKEYVVIEELKVGPNIPELTFNDFRLFVEDKALGGCVGSCNISFRTNLLSFLHCKKIRIIRNNHCLFIKLILVSEYSIIIFFQEQKI